MAIEEKIIINEGITEGETGKILILACGALAREILDIRSANGMTHLDLHCLPAILHNTPEKIPAAVEAAVLEKQHAYENIYVAYADCGTGGLLQMTCERLGVEMIEGPHCYSFFEGNQEFAAREEFTVFYLTDFLARHYETFVIKPLGLDKHPELRDMYFGSYTGLVYQAQTENPELMQRAKECAAALGLPFIHRPTGYGDLENWIKRI